MHPVRIVIMGWNTEFHPDPTFTAWGPFIRDDYHIQPVTYRAITIASSVFGLAGIFAILAATIAYRQTKANRSPLRSVYIWMIWLELAASVVIAIECLLYLLKVIRPSFWFFMSIRTSLIPPGKDFLDSRMQFCAGRYKYNYYCRLSLTEYA